MAQSGVPSREHLAQFYGKIFARHKAKRGFDPGAVELQLNIIRTADLIRSVFEKRMRAYELTPPSFGLLMLLSVETEGLQMNEIGRRFLVTRANITGLVDTLAKRGLVERKMKERDRRVILIRVTSKGMRRLDTILPGHFPFVAGLYRGIADSRRRAVVGVLEEVRSALIKRGKGAA